MPTDHKGYEEAVVKLIMALARAGVFEAIEKHPPETQVALLEDAIKFLVAQTELQDGG